MRNNDFLSIRTTNRKAQSISAVGMARSMDMTLPDITARRTRTKRNNYKYDELDEPNDGEFLRDDEPCSL